MKQLNIKRIAACALCAGALFPTCGQAAYTLEQCRQMALEHNTEMLNARNNLKGAEQTRKEAFTNYFPSVSATGMGFNAHKETVAMSLGEGMDLALLKNGIMGGVTAVQPIFAGGQIINGNKLAKVGADVSRLQLEQSENQVELTVEQYFWQVITLKEKLHTVTLVDSMLQRLCKDVEVAVNAGVTTRNDLLQVRLKQNEMASARIKLENGLSLSKMLLAQYIGADSAEVEPIADIPTDMLPASPNELYCAPATALSLTPEYRLLEKNVEANKLQHRLAVGKNLPSAGIGAGYMYHDLMDKGRSFGMVFATVSVPLSGWWGGSHAIKRQKLQLQNAENDLTDKSQLLMIRMQNAWNELDDAYKQLHIAQSSIEQSAENLRLNNDYYKAGTTNMTDLLNAQSMYQQSRDNFVDAYSTYQTKRVEYLQATGR